MKKTLGKSDHLYFLIGMDAFKDIAKWYEAEALLAECDFIVAARPGFSLADVASSLPEKLRPQAAVTKLFRKQKIEGPLVLPGATLHTAAGNSRECFSHANSRGRRPGGALKKLVPDAVAEYIHKQQLYRTRMQSAQGRNQRTAHREAEIA